ncbi:MAG TPA: cytochrome c peroxidase [Chitinophagaceae bacterium]|nr:cytochrome c peroxidase [Chitinophagaceae bacterium]
MRKSILAITFLITLTFVVSYILGACRKEQSTKGLELMEQEIPSSFPQPYYTFYDNPLTKEGFELGRKLFYDERLSVDNLHPCSSCHQQIAAFGTYEHDRSHGVHNSHTLRNAPVLFNLAWNTSFHWDGEFKTLSDEAVHPITGSLEMGETLEDIIKKIQDDPYYKEQFKKVFNYPFIKPEYILKALAQFTGSIVSANSKYDRYKKGEVAFTAEEENGYQLFKSKCATCHPEPLFTDFSLRNIGLPVDPFLNDFGSMRITGKSEDSLKFKVPTLRNVNISANYMHDGRFNTLQQCLNFYRSGVQQSTTLDPLLINGIPMTNSEVNDMMSFLKTLTDSTIMSNPKFIQPD